MRTLVMVLAALAALVAGAGTHADDGGGGYGDGSGAKTIQLDPGNPGFAACLRTKLGSAVAIDTGAGTATIQPGHEAELRECYAGGAGATAGTGSEKAAKAAGTIIVANPLDLGAVTGLSLFRSCAGHDYSGLDVQGVRETDRSMKHYVITSLPLEPADAMRGYAPFSGTVTVTAESFPLGRQIRVTAADGWTFVFFHGDPLVASGKKVKAGQPVAAWPPKNARDAFRQAGMVPDSISTFDIAFQSHGTFDSPLAHMTPKVASLWAAKGFTPATAIVSRAARDAQPCGGSYNGTHAGTDFVSATG